MQNQNTTTKAARHAEQSSLYKMHKSARDFALKHKISLGRYDIGFGARTGYYYIAETVNSTEPLHKYLSNDKTASSAIAMMRRYLRHVSNRA